MTTLSERAKGRARVASDGLINTDRLWTRNVRMSCERNRNFAGAALYS